MILELKLRKGGNSVGLVLPKEALAHLKVNAGDTIILTEAQDGLRPPLAAPRSSKPWPHSKA